MGLPWTSLASEKNHHVGWDVTGRASISNHKYGGPKAGPLKKAQTQFLELKRVVPGMDLYVRNLPQETSTALLRYHFWQPAPSAQDSQITHLSHPSTSPSGLR